jgi:hypothetical protein
VKRLVLATLLAVAACGGGSSHHEGDPDAGPPPMPDAAPVDFTKCTGSDESFVRNASLALIGRRPLSEGEVDVYAQLLRAVKEKDKAAGLGDDPQHARRVTARALMANPEYVARWERHFMEKLRVQRLDDQDMRGCYGTTLRQPDDGTLARAVRDATPRTQVAGGTFTMRDLLHSAVVADDITPVYRGNLFALVSHAIPAANVSPVEAELARREDFGGTFDAVYLNRDIVCLGCHNSEASTTDRDDPKEDRFWPLPGLFEKSIYGLSTGEDPLKAHAMFRYDGFVGDQQAPWGMTSECGTFNPDNVQPDLANIDAKFGKITGKTATVYDTEAALAHGFQVLREDGLIVGADNTIADPDAAFAYLVAVNIVDGVWSEVTGNSLVIANYFPRNEPSRDILHLLTEKYVASGFSLQALLEEIVAGPYFDRLPPAAGCGAGPYNMPPYFDPGAKSDSVEERRQNGPGDGVHALTTRTAAHAAYEALGWQATAVQDFPALGTCDKASCSQLGFYCQMFTACCAEKHNYCELGLPRPDEAAADDELAFQSGTGMFLKNAERGFRGLEFQARLEWENRFGQCNVPAGLGAGAGGDFVDGLVARAAATPGTTLRDVVVALKDRLISDPAVTDAGEQAAIEAMLGAGLDTPAANLTGLESGVRRVCGAIMSSPEFLLGGQAPQQALMPAPKLTPASATFASVCAAVAGRSLPESLQVTCGSDGSLTIH